ncbi:MAG: hypothetical protein V4488_19560 [Pseudomonadota bacterium]
MPDNVVAESANTNNGGWLSTIRGIVVALTALLAAVPALIYSGSAVYKAVFDIPTNVYDQANKNLGDKHRGEVPIIDQPIAVKKTNMTLDMTLHVYANGDVYIQYADLEQWLPFVDPSSKKPTTTAPKTGIGLSLISSAYAQEINPRSQTISAEQKTNVRPSLNFDLDKLELDRKNNAAAQANARPQQIEREYLITELKDNHPYLVQSSLNAYEKTFAAEPGYKITAYSFQPLGLNNSKIEKIDSINNGEALKVTYTMSSGPVLNRWSGSLKGVIKTTQTKKQ